MTLLHILATQQLPHTVEGGDDVDAVHILVMGGHVEAVMAKAVRATNGWKIPSATVTRITSSGKRMIRVFPAEFCRSPESTEKLMKSLNSI